MTSHGPESLMPAVHRISLPYTQHLFGLATNTAHEITWHPNVLFPTLLENISTR